MNAPHIRQIEKGLFSKDLVGKWFVSTSEAGPRNHTINRYLQEDGSWGQNVYYFDTEEQLSDALDKNIQPDFNASDNELHWLDVMREDFERGFDEDEPRT